MTGRFFVILLLAGTAGSAMGAGSAPVISKITLTPDHAAVGETYTITLRIADPQGADDIINTLILIREEREVIHVLIHDDGLDGDAVKGDGLYTGTDVVPMTAEPGTHQFTAHVRDHMRQKSNILKFELTVVQSIEI